MRDELKKVNAYRFIPANDLGRAVMLLAVTRTELAFINRDLHAGTFDLSCALARTAQTAKELRAAIKEDKAQVRAAYDDRADERHVSFVQFSRTRLNDRLIFK